MYGASLCYDVVLEDVEGRAGVDENNGGCVCLQGVGGGGVRDSSEEVCAVKEESDVFVCWLCCYVEGVCVVGVWCVCAKGPLAALLEAQVRQHGDGVEGSIGQGEGSSVSGYWCAWLCTVWV